MSPPPYVRHALIALLAPASTACALTDLDLDGGAVVQRVSIAPGELSVEIDTVRRMKLTVTYDDGFEEVVDRDVEWTVMDGGIATFDNERDLRGRRRGTTMLEARYDDQVASAMLTVFDRPAGLDVRTVRNDVLVGLARDFRAELRYSRGDREDVTALAVWSSAVPGVASVVGGVATGLAPGDTVIRAAYEGYEAAAGLHVNPAGSP